MDKYTIIAWLPMYLIGVAYVIWLAVSEQLDILLLVLFLFISFFLYTKWFGYWSRKSIKLDKGEEK